MTERNGHPDDLIVSFDRPHHETSDTLFEKLGKDGLYAKRNELIASLAAATKDAEEAERIFLLKREIVKELLADQQAVEHALRIAHDEGLE
jgi:hypothetical protein